MASEGLASISINSPSTSPPTICYPFTIHVTIYLTINTPLPVHRASNISLTKAAAEEELTEPRRSEFRPASERRCTDVCALVFFIAHLLLMLAVAGVAYGYGDPDKLLYASDHTGATCGTGDKLDRPLIYYPHMQEGEKCMYGSWALEPN